MHEDLKFVDHTVARLGRSSDLTIAILQAIQEHYRYLPEEALRRVCELTDITPERLTGVSTFYGQFRHRPAGKHLIRVCHGTACHVKGAPTVQEALYRFLKIADGNDTDEAGEFTIEKVACLGCCTLAPVVQIDQVTYGHLTPDSIPRMLRDFLAMQEARSASLTSGRDKTSRDGLPEIRLGLGSCCVARGSGKVQDALEFALADLNIKAHVKRVGCVGMCHQTPLVEVLQKGKPAALYARVEPADVPEILLRHFRPGGLAKRLRRHVQHTLDHILTDEVNVPPDRYAINVRDEPVQAFLGPQQHLATEHRGCIDPTDLEEYLSNGGFEGLKAALALEPAEIIRWITESGLRGRGGAGFPTGRKWSAVRAAMEKSCDPKAHGKLSVGIGAPSSIDNRQSTIDNSVFIVCNGDEGDPGAFMDRMLLESYPYRVIEGFLIAARAVGATGGFFYIRAEYPLALQRMREALDLMRKRGLLGNNIFSSGWGIDITIKEGAGAFVCGEETALLASIEGRRGMPRLRPPFPAERGLWGRPTLVNNVETYALVPWIIRHGAGQFAALGTKTSKGTKVFALAGKIARGGLIEVPMGATLRQIVEDIGGGVETSDHVAQPPSAVREVGKTGDAQPGAAVPHGPPQFKAVQVGGPSGGCVPAALADTPVDYEALTAAGAIMGSGGLVVLDDADCMVEIARYFLEFTQNQSCGKCTPCRIGTRRMLEMLERIARGEGKAGDLEALEALAKFVQQASLCGLGRTAPNPVLSTLKYFRAEYEAHLAGRCPAHRCKALIHYRVTDECIGCTICAQRCPVEAIELRPYSKHEVIDEKCTRCDTCRQVCPQKAIVVE